MPRPFSPKKDETVHVTVRCNNKARLFNLETNFPQIVSWVNCLPFLFDISLHHVLLMSNHIHMLLTPNENNIGMAMSYFLTNLSKFLNYDNQRINHIFGNRYRPTRINDERHLLNVIRYIYQNPIKSNLVTKITKYPYSSLGFYLGTNNPGFMITPDEYSKEMFDFGINGQIKWFNHVSKALTTDDWDLLDSILIKNTFKFSQKHFRQIPSMDITLML